MYLDRCGVSLNSLTPGRHGPLRAVELIHGRLLVPTFYMYLDTCGISLNVLTPGRHDRLRAVELFHGPIFETCICISEVY